MTSAPVHEPPPGYHSCATAMSETPSPASELPAAWARLPGGVADGGEIVLLAVKPSSWRAAFDSAPWIVTTASLAGALTILDTPLPGLSLTMTAQIVLLIGLVGTAVAVLRWVSTWYVLTNRRIISIRGVREPRVFSWTLLDVRNTYLHSPPAERLVGLGTITFVTDEVVDPPHQWRSVARPEEIHGRIRRAIENAIDQSGLA